MISYHPGSLGAPLGTPYTRGFKVADINDPERIANGISRYAWAPAAFKDGWRRRENFLYADWVGLDFEDPEFSLEDAQQSFVDMVHVIGTSRNHQKVKDGKPPIDRFRVLLRLTTRCDKPRDFETTVRALAGRYPIDTQCVDCARHFFPCREIISVSADGYTEDIVEARQVSPAQKERQAALAKAGVMPPLVIHVLTTKIPTGTRNATFYKATKDLLRCGFSEESLFPIITHSPTYQGVMGPDLERELRGLVRSAVKSFRAEVDDGRREEGNARG